MCFQVVPEGVECIGWTDRVRKGIPNLWCSCTEGARTKSKVSARDLQEVRRKRWPEITGWTVRSKMREIRWNFIVFKKATLQPWSQQRCVSANHQPASISLSMATLSMATLSAGSESCCSSLSTFLISAAALFRASFFLFLRPGRHTVSKDATRLYSALIIPVWFSLTKMKMVKNEKITNSLR